VKLEYNKQHLGWRLKGSFERQGSRVESRARGSVKRKNCGPKGGSRKENLYYEILFLLFNLFWLLF